MYASYWHTPLKKSICSIHKGYDLCAGAGGIGAEIITAGAGGDVLHGAPLDALEIVGVGRNIGEGAGEHPAASKAAALRLHISIDKGDGLCPAHGGIRRESVNTGASSDAFRNCPTNRLG